MLNKSKISKIKNKIYKGKKCILKKISVSKSNKDYLYWINDKRVNRFLEFRFEKINKKKLKEFIINSNKDYSTILYGIFRKKKHIGNIKISINWNHGYAVLGYMIGNLNFQGSGIGAESIKICKNICFKLLKLRFCLASVYSNNIASIKVLKKNKFKLVSRIKKMYKFNNNYVDELNFVLKNTSKKN